MTAPDTNAIRAQMEALTGFTAGPWRDEDGVIQSQTTVWQNGVKQVGWDYAAIRAEVTDDWDQAANARLIAAAPDMHATILALCDALDDAKAENERLQAIIDNLHAVEENSAKLPMPSFTARTGCKSRKGVCGACWPRPSSGTGSTSRKSRPNPLRRACLCWLICTSGLNPPSRRRGGE